MSPRTSWQRAATSTNGLESGSRPTPDVAWDANPSTGVSVYDSVSYYGRAGWFTVGGTSVGAPSWAGLIAIADQGLALNGVGSLSNAQASLYELSSTNFNHPTSGSSGSSSTATFSLATGLGSPKANLLVPALVQLNIPTSTPATISVAVMTHTSSRSVGRLDLLPSPPVASPTPTGSSSGTSSSSSSSSTTISITPLNPSLTSTLTSGKQTVVILVPPPLPPVVIHLGTSVSPVTAQAIFSPLAAQEEQPTLLTHFGQSFEAELQKPFQARLGPQTDGTPLLDAVEPFQPLGLDEAPRDEPAPAPGPRGAWLLRLLSDPGIVGVLEPTDHNALRGALGGTGALAKDRRAGMPSSWGFSTIFGAAAVAVGGYRAHDPRGGSIPSVLAATPARHQSAGAEGSRSSQHAESLLVVLVR